MSEHSSPTTSAGGTRTVVITGGNSGLGYATATAILQAPGESPWRVILACRDPQRAQDAVDRLESISGGSGSVEAMSLDLASLASVRQFANDLARRVQADEIPPVHALVCNAGVQSGANRTTTVDGFESTFGVNHLGHFLLVNEVLPQLQVPARVVVVASNTHDPAKKAGAPVPAWNSPLALARGELAPSADGDSEFVAGGRRYTTSKLANVYFTYGLGQHLPQGITANAFDPGLMPGTSLTRNASAPLRFAAKHVMPRIIPLLRRTLGSNVHTPKESGVALACLITDDRFSGISGKYFEQNSELRSSDESYDDARINELWQDSLTLTAQT